MNTRDRIIVMIMIGISVAAASWLLVLSPKRDDIASVKLEITQAQTSADSKTALAGQAEAARGQYDRDYRRLVELGRGLPAKADMASLIYVIDQTATRYKVDFSSVNVTATVAAAAPPPPAVVAATADKNAPPAASSPPAESTPAAGTESLPGGVTKVPVVLRFEGTFNRMTRFLRALETLTKSGRGAVSVKGRLVSIDGVSVDPSSGGFPRVAAEVTAGVYYAPLTSVGDVAATAAAATSSPAGAAVAAAPASSKEPVR